MDCGGNGGAGPKVGVIPDAGPATSSTRTARRAPASTRASPTRMRPTRSGTVGTDHPASPPSAIRLRPTSPAARRFLAPAAGLIRALDLAASEYQTAARTTSRRGTRRPASSAPASPAHERPPVPHRAVRRRHRRARRARRWSRARANLDLQAFTRPAASRWPAWPKLTADWMVANPLIGSFGEPRSTGRRRSWWRRSRRPACSSPTRRRAGACARGLVAALPPRQRQLGRLRPRRRRARASPTATRSSGATVTFKAPGDDLLCGTLAAGEKGARYEAVQSTAPITAAQLRRRREDRRARDRRPAGHGAGAGDSGPPQALPGDPRGGRAGQRRPAARHPRAEAEGRPRGLSPQSTSHSSSAFWAWRRFSAWSQMRWRGP